MPSTPLILYPAMPFSSCREVDPDFAKELAAASTGGFATGLIDFEELLDGQVRNAVRRVPESSDDAPFRALIRSWMQTSPQYARLCDALLNIKGVELVTSPSAYRKCHELPGWYEAMIDFTPETLIQPGLPPDVDSFTVAVQHRFASDPVIIKDFVKTRKHEWLDACFVPDCSDTLTLNRAVTNFTDRQGSDLTGGLVARRFVNLHKLGAHPSSGMPLSFEWRVFRFGSSTTQIIPYWQDEVGDAGLACEPEPTLDLQAILRAVDTLGSCFCTVDVALMEDGSPMVIEIGDGQVSDIRRDAEIRLFYKNLHDAFV